MITRGFTDDFRKLFEDRTKEWIAQNRVLEETKHPSARVLVDEEDRMETVSAVPEHEIFGFMNEVKSLENFLLDQKVYREFKSIVVYGEYGVGKTTLCQMIFNSDEVKSVYAPRIWVYMHSKESIHGLDGKICVLKKILKGLGFEDDMFECVHREAVEESGCTEEAWEIDDGTVREKEISALLYALHFNLRWKKYLIVFDDVREEDNWNEKLGIDEEQLQGMKWGDHLSDGFPKGSGGRVIYTTRDENLAKKLVIDEHEMHRLWPLSDPLSVWKIYEESVLSLKNEPPRQHKKCIDELMNKTRGLPLAARLMATLDPVFLDDEPPLKRPFDSAKSI